MIGEALGLGAVAYAASVVHARLRGRLANSAYPSPDESDAELDAIAKGEPGRVRIEEYGRSAQGRPLRLLRIGSPGARGRLLVTGQIHAGEFVAGYVARAVARALAAADGDEVVGLLESVQVLVAPHLNPDGAHRVWNANGWTRFRGLRATAGGVDPNRNFPFAGGSESAAATRSWNSGRDEPVSAHYRGPRALSEPECAALAELAARERFAAALNFHSFGGIVYLPESSGVFALSGEGGTDDAAARGLRTIASGFPSRQKHCAYRVVPERPETIEGQLDAFLLGAFGTASATIEVGRPGLAWFAPSRFGNPFWVFNPPNPDYWVDNDVAATVATLAALARETGGVPGVARQPELADSLVGARASGTEEAADRFRQ